LEEDSREGRVERLQSFISLCRVTAAFFLFLTLSDLSHHPEGLELVPVIMTLRFLTVVLLLAKREAQLLSLCERDDQPQCAGRRSAQILQGNSFTWSSRGTLLPFSIVCVSVMVNVLRNLHLVILMIPLQ
jgi:hypothetical protein